MEHTFLCKVSTVIATSWLSQGQNEIKGMKCFAQGTQEGTAEDSAPFFLPNILYSQL
jgi:hypothetical protein